MNFMMQVNTLLLFLTLFCNGINGSGKIAKKYSGCSIMMISPKYHCKIAGDGIEYLWGYGKLKYCRVPMNKKKTTKKDFESFVKQIFSSETIPPILICKFSCRACQYICAYYHLQHPNKNNIPIIDVKLVKSEKIQRFKTK